MLVHIKQSSSYLIKNVNDLFYFDKNIFIIFLLKNCIHNLKFIWWSAEVYPAAKARRGRGGGEGGVS